MPNNKRRKFEANSKMAEKYSRVLSVRIDSTPKASLLRKIAVDIKNNRKFYIVTPNPEQIMIAQSDEIYRSILDKAKVSIPDGVGLSAANKFLSLPRPKHPVFGFFILLLQGLRVGLAVLFDKKWLESEFKVIRGRDMFRDLISLANKSGWRVFLLGGEGNEGILTKKEIEKNYKNLIIKTRNGPILNSDGSPRTKKDREEEKLMARDINAFSPDLLIIGMTPPKQEKLLYRWYNSLNFRCSILVGGTFRYVSGKVILPPKFIADMGLEWLWRLLTGSQKWGRIVNAAIKFPLAVFRYKLLEGASDN